MFYDSCNEVCSKVQAIFLTDISAAKNMTSNQNKNMSTNKNEYEFDSLLNRNWLNLAELEPPLYERFQFSEYDIAENVPYNRLECVLKNNIMFFPGNISFKC